MKDVGSEGSTKAMTSETDCREWRLNGPPRTWGMDGTSKVGARGQAMHGIGHGWITKDVWIWMAMQDMDGPLRTWTPKHAVQDSPTRSFFSLLDLPAFPLAHSRAKKAIVVLLKEKKKHQEDRRKKCGSLVSNEHSREREEGCEMCAGDERKPGPACGVQGEKLITASEGWLCPWVQGCSCHTGRIFYLRHLAVEIVPFISAELAFHVTRVVSLGLCLSPSG